ncbi:hypothetical protein ENSA5_51900 [Enhygromyxa salina]|uniref:SnoaL-like domain-containing protein n=1 Tax=Enhygromyxa salina TaxID=215803 RepID=A0A2S9XGI5_9BACT|nr:hypothetical protein [Enhygromyxa salina]PRP91979.1 hypothetical protein ENSA5_51900 [Enhygromyxa salina]
MDDPPAEPPSAPAAAPPADLADVDSLDGIVNALYASISFEAGEHPAWPRFRSLFDPAAVMVRVDSLIAALPPDQRDTPPLRVSTIEDYISRTTAAIESGALTAFVERELTRRTEVFADLAQVFSTYERCADAGEVRRGINSLQLVKDSGRWRVISLTWTDETDDGPLPSRYLPRT